MEKFYRELPEGFREDMVVDAKGSKKTILLLNILAVLVCIPPIVWLLFYYLPENKLPVFDSLRELLVRDGVFIAALLAYVVCHELVHGFSYKMLTGEKLTFGITLSAAYCGVPNIYTSRKTALISTLTPFVLFLPIFSALSVWTYGTEWFYILYSLLIIHISGCVGDLYVAFLLLTKYADREVLMNDTGPKMTFYTK